MTSARFLASLGADAPQTVDKAVAVMWLAHQTQAGRVWTVGEIASGLEAAGYSKPNTTRLRDQLRKDKRTARSGDGFRINAGALATMDAAFSVHYKSPVVKQSDSVLETGLFSNARTYIMKVVAQINSTFDTNCFDACATMCRRLLETLIIEAYESQGKESELKGQDGNYLMLKDLVEVIEKHDSLNMGRNTKKGLKALKLLGDLSAHARRYNARKLDITNVQSHLRVASEELLHLAGQA